jgi:hypothetical protein
MPPRGSVDLDEFTEVTRWGAFGRIESVGDDFRDPEKGKALF